MDIKRVLIGILIWAFLIGVPVCIVKCSEFYENTMTAWTRRTACYTVAIVAILIAAVTLPMGLSPTWNGKRLSHRNQYELMADAILQGHLYIDYGDVDKKLLAMENPYNPAQRQALKVSYHWDHAFYNGKYYMYFGVVPVFLLFIPFKLLTGMSLTTYHATQVFAAFFVVGMFYFFWTTARNYFEKMSIGLYWMLSIAFSMIGIWYAVTTPSLYCTAITSGVCLELWSIIFFIKALREEESRMRRNGFAFAGAVCGALTFGCRPTVALANIIFVPVLILLYKNLQCKLFPDLAFICSPYAVIGCLLMWYNYARFDNPFEFGQKYQLTITDQTGYSIMEEVKYFPEILLGLFDSYFKAPEMTESFPFFSFGGVYFNFSILFVVFAVLFSEKTLEAIRKCDIFPVLLAAYVAPIIITISWVIWSPIILERYKMDIYWLLGILSFIIIGFFYKNSRNQRMVTALFGIWAYTEMIKSVLLFLVPNDENFAEVYPEVLSNISHYIFFWS